MLTYKIAVWTSYSMWTRSHPKLICSGQVVREGALRQFTSYK